MQKSSFRFKNPQLTSLGFKGNNKYKAKELLTLDIIDKVVVETVNETSAVVTLILKIFKEEDFPNVPFAINIEMKGEFSWDSDMDIELAKRLLNQNAPAVLLSYIRPYITTLTTGGGYPPLVLPLMNFTK